MSNQCKHDASFRFTTTKNGEAYFCTHGCGFHMNFNPIWAGEVKSGTWKDEVLSIGREHPPESKEITLKSSKY